MRTNTRVPLPKGWPRTIRSAVIERLIRTIKSECTRKLTVPYRRERFRQELSL